VSRGCDGSRTHARGHTHLPTPPPRAPRSISCGYDLVEYHPRLWNPTKNIPIVHIDFTPAEVDAHYRCMIEAVGDLSHSLWMLNERQKREPIAFDPAVYADVRDIMLKDFASLAEDATVGALKPQKVLWDVRKVLGAEDILLSDVGAHKMWIARYYQCEAPNTCLISNGFCSMGFALPGAIGAKIAFPERRVLAICGDGGFLMNVQEMETAKRVGANIVVMVWCDGGYGLISWKQDTRYGRHTNLSFENPKFDHLAAAFGWKHFHVRESAALAATLQQAFSESCPVLVSLDIDYSENPKLTKRLGGLRMQN
jgi:acetolactate synthase-1/2/3 large subunit